MPDFVTVDSISIVTTLRAGRPGFDSQHGRDFSLLHHANTSSEVHPASYPMGIGCCFPGNKAAGAWSWPLTSILCRV